MALQNKISGFTNRSGYIVSLSMIIFQFFQACITLNCLINSNSVVSVSAIHVSAVSPNNNNNNKLAAASDSTTTSSEKLKAESAAAKLKADAAATVKPVKTIFHNEINRSSSESDSPKSDKDSSIFSSDTILGTINRSTFGSIASVPTPTGIWAPFRTTTQHQKQAGNGYLAGSPLFGQTENTVMSGGGTGGFYSPHSIGKLSVTMSCILALSTQFFIILTAVVVMKTIHEFLGRTQPSSLLEALQVARGTLTFVPMICVLFLAIRLRAVQLSNGDPEKYNLPQDWVQNFMISATVAVIFQTFLVIGQSAFGISPQLDDDGNIIPSGTPFSVRIQQFFRCACLLTLWVSLAGLMVGVWLIEPPKEIWGAKSDMRNNDYPWPAPAVKCTMNMANLFFLIYLCLAVLKELRPTQTIIKLINLLTIATHTISLAPIFCILFIGARLRALSVNPPYGKPQSWAADAMYVTCYSMIIQIVAILVVGLFLRGEPLRGNCEGDIRFRVKNPVVMTILQVIRWGTVLGLYAGSIVVLVSIFKLERDDGSDAPSLSVAMRCTVELTVLYMIVYLGLFIVTTVRMAGSSNLSQIQNAFDSARNTVFFAPMMTILFIGAQLRAFQISGGTGQPQGYAEDVMVISNWTIWLQTFLCLSMGIGCFGCCTLSKSSSSSSILSSLSDRAEGLGRGENINGGSTLTSSSATATGAVEIDEEGNVKMPTSTQVPTTCKYLLEAIRYVSLLGLYGGAITLIYAMFDMRPDNVNGENHIFPFLEKLYGPKVTGDVVVSTSTTTTTTTIATSVMGST